MEDATSIFALIGVIISAMGITIGLLYNARSIKQNTRTRYYQIQKDIEKEYHKVMVENFEDDGIMSVRINNFAIFLIKIVNRKMIPKKHILPYYDDVMGQALYVQDMLKDTLDDRPGLKKEVELLQKFCKENNIEKDEPFFITYPDEKDTKET